jgi:hypothetical protein
VLNGVANARGNATTSLNFTYSTIPDLSSGVTTAKQPDYWIPLNRQRLRDLQQARLITLD